jgi:hypothetical protein
MCDLAPMHWCMQVEVFLEVDPRYPDASHGGTQWWWAIFPTMTAVDFLPEVRHHVACHRCAMLRRRARMWQLWRRLRHGWCVRH